MHGNFKAIKKIKETLTKTADIFLKQ